MRRLWSFWFSTTRLSVDFVKLRETEDKAVLRGKTESHVFLQNEERGWAPGEGW
jgi:hypothetical protein